MLTCLNCSSLDPIGPFTSPGGHDIVTQSIHSPMSHAEVSKNMFLCKFLTSKFLAVQSNYVPKYQKECSGQCKLLHLPSALVQQHSFWTLCSLFCKLWLSWSPLNNSSPPHFRASAWLYVGPHFCTVAWKLKAVNWDTSRLIFFPHISRVPVFHSLMCSVSQTIVSYIFSAL